MNEYWINVFKLLAVYKYIPNNMELIVKAYPQLKPASRLLNTIRRMKQEGYVERLAIGDGNLKHEKDTIRLTKKGYAVLKKEKIKSNTKAKNRKTENQVEQQRRLSELDIFMRGAIEKSDDKYFKLKFTDRDTILNRRRKKDGDIRQYFATRMHGVIETDDNIIPVYHIGLRNMQINKRAEKSLYKVLCNEAQKDKENMKQILFGKNVKVLEKLFNDYDNERSIFRPNEFVKSYLILNTLKQQVLVELFRYEGIETMFNDRGTVKKKYRRVSTYETEEEIGVNLIQQELHQMYKLKAVIEKIENGEIEEYRHFVVYATDKSVYDALYGKYDNLEFREVSMYEVLYYALGRAATED